MNDLPMVASKPHLMVSADLFLPCLCMPTQSLQSCPIFCDPLDHSSPGSSVCGFSTRILKWVAMPTSKISSWPRDQPTCSVSLALQVDYLPPSHWESPLSCLLKENTLAMPFLTLHYKRFLYSGSFLTAYKYTTISLNIKKIPFFWSHLSLGITPFICSFSKGNVSKEIYILAISSSSSLTLNKHANQSLTQDFTEIAPEKVTNDVANQYTFQFSSYSSHHQHLTQLIIFLPLETLFLFLFLVLFLCLAVHSQSSLLLFLLFLQPRGSVLRAPILSITLGDIITVHGFPYK